MSHRQRVSISHAHIFLIVAFLLAAGGHTPALAQTDRNPETAKPPVPAESAGQSVEPSQSAPADPGADLKSSPDGLPAMVVDGEHVQGILGKPVRSSAGEDMGRIVDVLVDRSARVRAAVIDFGGFLGVGNRQIAVAWSAIRFSAEGKREPLVVDFTRDQLRVAPAYKAGEQIVLLGAPGNSNVVATPANSSPAKEPPAK